MLSFERRWVRGILSSFAPEGGPGLAPRADEVDYLAAFELLACGAAPVARVGLRVALWLVALSPVWLARRVCTFAALPEAQRVALLTHLLEHRVFAIRESAFLLKTVASLALLGHNEVRARSGYDGNVRPIERPRSSLPVARGGP